MAGPVDHAATRRSAVAVRFVGEGLVPSRGRAAPSILAGRRITTVHRSGYSSPKEIAGGHQALPYRYGCASTLAVAPQSGIAIILWVLGAETAHFGRDIF